MNNFQRLLWSMGDEAAATRYAVSIRTVRSWRLAEREPRPEQARAIVQRERGRVSFEDIYGKPPQ